MPVYQDLSKEQDVITNLPLSGRHIVVGPPGTGKTVVALYRAELWRNRGDDAQFIVYNKTLNQYLSLAIDEKGLNDHSATFHSWFAKWYYHNFHRNVPQIQQYVYDWDRVLENVGRKGDKIPRVKNLIIDEGQDFPREMYTVLSLITENITVFADENQRITANNSTIRDIRNALGVQKTHKLTRNYRNTRQIAEFASQFYAGLPTGVAELPTRKGPLPYLLVNQDISSEIKLIEQYAMANRNKQIGVFVKTTDKQKEFYKHLAAIDWDISVQMYKSGSKTHGKLDFQKNGIFLLCYPSTKGLEFDTVFYPDLDEWRTDGNPDIEKMQFYVLTSRARNELIMMSKDEDVPKFMQHIPESHYTVRNVHVNQKQ